LSVALDFLFNISGGRLLHPKSEDAPCPSDKVLRRIFGPKRDEVTGGWRKLHKEELHNLYSSPSIIRMIKSRRFR
jgi:hypothetical protein